MKYYPKSILRPYFKSTHQGEPFRHSIWERDQKIIFGLLIVFPKFYLLCANQKSYCWGGGKNYLTLLPTSNGTGLSPKTWKKLTLWENEMPYCAFTTVCYPSWWVGFLDDFWQLNFLQFTRRLLSDFLTIPYSSVECLVTCLLDALLVILRSSGFSAPSWPLWPSGTVNALLKQLAPYITVSPEGPEMRRRATRAFSCQYIGYQTTQRALSKENGYSGSSTWAPGSNLRSSSGQ